MVLHESVCGSGDSVDVIGRRRASIDVVMRFINLFFRIISLGSLKPEQSQYFYVLQKLPSGRDT
jgi:hypothetical protein